VIVNRYPNVPLDLLRNVNKLLFVAQFVDDFDKAAEKHIAGNKEEKQQHDSDRQAHQKALRVQEEKTTKSRAVDPDGHFGLIALGHVFDTLRRVSQLIKGLFQDRETLFQPRQAFGRFGNPICRGRRDADADAGDDAKEHDDHEKRGDRPGKAQAGERIHRRLQQQVEYEGEKDRDQDLAGDIAC
jgi:hypothetical protein